MFTNSVEKPESPAVTAEADGFLRVGHRDSGAWIAPLHKWPYPLDEFLSVVDAALSQVSCEVQLATALRFECVEGLDGFTGTTINLNKKRDRPVDVQIRAGMKQFGIGDSLGGATYMVIPEDRSLAVNLFCPFPDQSRSYPYKSMVGLDPPSWTDWLRHNLR